MKKIKKLSSAKLKKKLDEIFSQYIRQKYADSEGNIKCYTCDKTMHWKEGQCGHFVSRQYLATRFEEKNCRPQCMGCNVFGNGRLATFAEKLTKEYGEAHVNWLYRKAQEVVRYYPYEEKIKEYKEKLK